MLKLRIIALVALLVLLVQPLPPVSADTGGPTVIINELMWMGSSASSFDEWIELRNTTDQPIDLGGWYLTRKASGVETAMLTIPTGQTIDAHGMYLISNYDVMSASSVLSVTPQLVDSAVSLANTQLQIKLYASNNSIQDIADDGSGAPLSGTYVSGTTWVSMERNYVVTDGSLKSSWHPATTAVGFKAGPELGTPGSANSNTIPIAVAGEDMTAYVSDIVTFDGTESSDADGDPLTYQWDFGDGATSAGPTPTHSYDHAGTFEVILTVSDGLAVATDSLVVTATQRPVQLTGDGAKPLYDPETQQFPAGTPNNNAAIILTEVFPNPVGLDKEAEFIELYNAELKPVLLTNWKITVGTKVFTFPAVTIPAQEYLALGYSTTKLTLTNAGATVSLLNAQGKMVSTLVYSSSAEGKSYVFFQGTWQWTGEPTPGEENVIQDVSQSLEQETAVPLVSIADIADLDQRTKVRTRGIVSVPPGIFGALYFYIFDGEAGIKIYSSKKDFPQLAIGDVVTVNGAVGYAEGERKINTSSADAIGVTGHTVAPAPLQLTVGEITDDSVGSLVQVEGVTDTVTKTQFTLVDGDQAAGVAIKKGTGIDTPRFTNGAQLTVTGVVGIKNDVPTIFPRTTEDISMGGTVLAANVERPSGDFEVMTATRQPINLPIILTLVMVAASGAGYWYWRKKRAQSRGVGYSNSLNKNGDAVG